MRKLLLTTLFTLILFNTAALGIDSGTPIGLLGKLIDLRSLLPVEIKNVAPKDAQGIRYEKTLDVGTPPAKVKLVWVTFKHSTGTYLLSYQASVVKQSSGVFLTAPTHNNPINLGTKTSIIESINLNFAWSRNTLTKKTFGTVVLRIRSDGQSSLL